MHNLCPILILIVSGNGQRDCWLLWDWDVCIQRVVRILVTVRNQTSSYSQKAADIKI